MAIERIQRNFLWNGMEKKKRMTLIAWDKVCKHIKKRGFWLRKISNMNDFLLGNLICRLYNDEGEWKDIWNNKYNMENKSFIFFLSSDDIEGGLVIWKHAQKNK